MKYFSQRLASVNDFFPGSLSMADFVMRTEMALGSHGFTSENAMAMTNLCRDEATGIFKTRLDRVFGSSFNMNGLGACLTCGCLGVKAGLSHGPNQDKRERYVFFSFPHIGITPEGKPGTVPRPGREGESVACGALAAALKGFQADPSSLKDLKEGEHDPADPEFSIMKQRLAARLAREDADVTKMNLGQFTALAERAITADLETMIAETVNTEQMDYAVVTGVQVHNWAEDDSGTPSLEFVWPVNFYVVVNGRRTDIDISALPALTPRQLTLLQNEGAFDADAAASVRETSVTAVMYK